MPNEKKHGSAARSAGPEPNAMTVTEGGADIGGALSRLLEFSGTDVRNSTTIASILAFVGSVLTLMGPSRLGKLSDIISDGLNGSIDLDSVAKVGWLLVSLYATAFVFTYISGFIMAGVSQKVTQRLRTRVSQKIDRLPLSYLDRHPTGDVLSLVSNDIDTITTSLNQSISSIVTSIAMIVGSVAIMLWTNLWMALAAIVAAVLGMLVMSRVMGKSQRHFAAQQTELGNIDSQIEETYSGLDVVRSFCGQDGARKTFDETNERLYDAAWKSSFYSSLSMPLMIFMGNLAYVAVCVVGSVLAISGAITFGVIVSFMLYVRQFTQPLQNISQAAQSVQSMAAACERVFDFLDEREMADESQIPALADVLAGTAPAPTGEIARKIGKPKLAREGAVIDVKGSVDFEHVRFGYTPTREIIHDFSAHARHGRKVAIVGPTGAGKTTMVNLLMRFYDIDGGDIRIDGMPIGNMRREDVHELFGMVLQDTWIFEGTLRENLVFDTPDVTDDDLDRVCEACGLTDLVRTCPTATTPCSVTRRASPSASASSSPSPAPCSRTPRCSSSTKRRARWTPAPNRRCSPRWTA